MNRSRLPPLNALRAFEAAARHLSVKSAAEELSVTPGAVSQMIRTLETHLGVQLFERVNRGILLTAAGRDYLPPVRNALRQIADASQRVSGAADSGVLTISVTPFFASAWLVPRLAQFRDACPDVDLQIVTSHARADFARDGVDVAIRHGLGRYAGLCSEHLLTVEIVARLGMPRTPAELVDWPHLHDAERKGWHTWFDAQRIDDFGPPRGPAFDDAGLLLQAIVAGQGAGLLPAAMVRGELANGRLVQLADVARLDDFAYYLVYPPHHAERPKVAAFRRWILDAARAGDAPSMSGAT
ncbi:transcriptional regulator GcvA [Burkholderia multivorans]|uniref:transcriptional regulator GcvA n=1 Tax=Burkholderia multivorans TaxID=87883 RepID=UPI000CFFE830|nr:transcriptional regulator GcvA [Burkholderia multivorans]PRG31094.1 LysR family transcriptional regulator [Burkholderia multivorans]